MNFFKTSFLASISTGVGMLCSLVTTKYVAMQVGPTGMAFNGQFINATTILTLLATAACTSGVVKYTAEYRSERAKRRLFGSAARLIAFCTLAISLIAIAFSKPLSRHAFGTDDYWQVFAIYGGLLIFSSFNALNVALLNGEGQIRRMTVMSIANSVVNLITVVSLAHFFKLTGVLVASSVTAFVSFFGYVYYARKIPWLHQLAKPAFKPDRAQIRLLLGFTAMNLTSGILAPALQLVVRTSLMKQVNVTGAGLWQANTRLSDLYLNFIYTVMGIYYLPKLSQLQDRLELRREIRLGFARILPAVGVLTLVIFFLREYIVRTFLTKEFLPMLPLIKWQLLGDLLKIASWLLAYLMVAKAMKRTFIATEIIFSVSYVVLSVVLVQTFGMVGAVYGFAANYGLYLLTMGVIMRKYIV